MFQLAATDSRVTNPESTTRGADRPSAANDHSRPRAGTQLTRSTSCRPLSAPSKCWLKATSINTRSARRTTRARVRGPFGSLPSPGRSGINRAAAAGSSTIKLSQGKDAACKGKLASITAPVQAKEIYQSPLGA